MEPLPSFSSYSLPPTRSPSPFGHSLERCPRNASSSQPTFLSFLNLSPTRSPSPIGHSLERCPRNASSSQLTLLPFLDLPPPAIQNDCTSTEAGQKKKRKTFKRYVKRFMQFLFHSDGGNSDSSGEIIFDPHAPVRRDPSVSERAGPVFREVDWSPAPRLERRGALRGHRGDMDPGAGRVECEGEECCGRRGRRLTRRRLVKERAGLEGGEEGVDASEVQEALGEDIVAMLRAHADSAIGGLEEGAHKFEAGSREGWREGTRQCEEVGAGDEGSEESCYGELSRHPSPKTGERRW
ncbi:MAG: hypothetical protein Q9195_003847 [Heterodermia aff. obscurata]